MTPTRLLLLVFYMSSAVSHAAAQTAAPAAPPQERTAEALPPARDVVGKYVQAIGGRDALLRHSSRRGMGTFAMPAQGVTGSIELLAAKPAKLVVVVAVPGLGEIRSGFDGTTAWLVNPMTGPMVLQGRQRDEAKHDASFFGMLHEDPDETIETLDVTEFGGRRCYRVSVRRKGGPEDIEYYDVATGLLAGVESERDSPMGVVKATTFVSDYRKFDDLLIATRTTQRVAGIEQVITLTSIEHDRVADAAFELPPQIRGLLGK